jgi:tripartite-type tricarboxylate transporter receptor subunit TctC
MKRVFIVFLCLIFVTIAGFATGRSAVYPSKPINLIVGFNPGGTSDMITRFIGKELEAILKVPVIVGNKPGASSAVAFEYLISQPADGYTVMYMAVETALLKPTGVSNLEPRDALYFARSTMNNSVLAVRSDAPYKTLQEFVSYCKANPGKVTNSNSGVAAFTYYAAVGFEQAAGIELNYVPFDGGPAAVTACMGGHVDSVACVSGEARAGVESGDLRILASLGEARSALFPQVPTLKESGYNISVPGWGCFAVPKGTPDNVVKILEDAFIQAINSQGFKDICQTNDWIFAPLSGKEVQSFAEAQAEQLQKLAATVKR